MAKLEVYLCFDGNCEEALHFYQQSLRGEVQVEKRFGETPMEVPDSHRDRVMHATFRSGEIFFMASDTRPGNPLNQGNNIALSLHFSDFDEQQRMFDKLGEGATNVFPLADQFWGSRFGMLTDRYSIRWMFSCKSAG